MYWTSRLHDNDAMLGVKTCRAACTCCAGRARWRSASQSVARARASPAVWHAGGWPFGCMHGTWHVAVPRLTPNTRGRPSVTSYAYGLYEEFDTGPNRVAINLYILLFKVFLACVC